MAAVDYVVGAMIAAELKYAGDQAMHKVYVPRKVMADAIPTAVLRKWLEERERADA
jgi:hypothetical protein